MSKMTNNVANWLPRFACVAACLLLLSCATTRPATNDAECKQESCLLPVLMDLSMPNAQKYLRVRRAIEAGFDVQNASGKFRQRYATLASFVGAYEEAERIYPLSAQDENPAAAGYTTATPAADTVRALARGTRVVLVNEAHASARTRAAIYTLLRPLREEGYEYLALEGLSTMQVNDANSCSDAHLFDEDLMSRGYPTEKTGFYTREPVFGEIIREALRLGYKLVAIESHDPAVTMSIENREDALARNLACIFKDDAQARVLVINGFGHIAEAPDAIVPGGMMAARFKAMTGIDPLSVDTTTLLHMEIAPYYFSESAKDRHPSQGYVLTKDTGHLFGTNWYDLALMTPSFAGRESNERSWLTLDGARNRVLAPTEGCGQVRPCVIEAFVAGESSGIAADACVLEPGDETCPLFLTKGDFRLEYYDVHGVMGSVMISNPSQP